MGKMVRALMCVTMAKDAMRGDKYTHKPTQIEVTKTKKRKNEKRKKKENG